MTTTLDRPTTKRSYFDKALPALPKAAQKPDSPAIVQYVTAWLDILAADPARGGEFDRELEAYGASLRASGAIASHLGSGFLLALWAYTNVGNPLVPTLIEQVDRRNALRGVRHCRWRGDVSQAEYDAPRYDEAERRVKLKNKHEREG
jgi:hypothetical protein